MPEKQKEKFSNILLAIIVLAFPFMFPGVYNFNNLYADFSIAAIFGFSLIYIFNQSREKNLSTAIVIMLSTIITLIKPQGFTLAICLIIIYVLNTFPTNLYSILLCSTSVNTS